MTREQNENFSQDRLGNVNRELDDVRGQDGMDATTTDGNPNGILEVTTGDDDGATDLIIMEIPDGASGFNLDEIHAFNSSSAEANFSIFTATLNDDGTIDTTTRRSVPYNVAASTGRTISYVGKEFGDDAIVVQSNFTGHIGLGGYMDRPEELEPASEQTVAPSQ